MHQKASSKSGTYVNVDPKTLDITISEKRIAPMAIPLEMKSIADMPPMWEMVYYKYVYGEYHRKQQAMSPGKRPAASLAPPPPWVVALAGVVWEGILQGAAWDVVKAALSSAVAKLRATGVAPQGPSDRATKTEIKAGWRELSEPGRKQYEMFLSLKRSAKSLPDRHALAYARAKDAGEFSKIVRSEIETSTAPKKSGTKKSVAKRSRAKKKA